MNTIKIDTGGRPFHNDDLSNIYSDNLEIIKSIGSTLNMAGTPMIIWGMLNVGYLVTEGAILGTDGEIYHHPSTTYSLFNGDTFLLDFQSTDEDSRTYYDGNDKYCHTSRQAILRTSTTSGWSAITYNEANANRLDIKLYNLLHNKLHFEVGDIYSTDTNGLQLQSMITTGNTYVNRYGGTLSIGESGYSPTTEVYGKVKMIGDLSNIWWDTFGAGSVLNVPVQQYDSMIYGYSATSVSNDFDVIVSVDAVNLVRAGAYQGFTVAVPAGSSCVITRNSGTATTFVVHQNKLGL